MKGHEHWNLRCMRWTLPAVVLASVTGCTGLLMPRPSFGEAHRDCGFPRGTELIFAGEATLAQFDLFKEEPERFMRGDLYVTAEPLTPDPDIVPDEVLVPPRRRFCLLGDQDRIGLIQIHSAVPEDWDSSVLP